MKNSADEIRFQIRSVIIVKFFELYKVLEKEAIDIFCEEIKNVDEKFKNKLYFLYGGNSNIKIDISNSKLYMDPKTFSVDEDFRNFTFNQIIKICKIDNKIKKFDFNINSMQKRQEEIDFYSSCEKLINMRNKLAHEILIDNFKDKDIVEMLSDKKIEENIISELSNFDIKLMNVPEKQIYSNLLYLNIIILKLTNKDKILNFICLGGID